MNGIIWLSPWVSLSLFHDDFLIIWWGRVGTFEFLDVHSLDVVGVLWKVDLKIQFFFLNLWLLFALAFLALIFFILFALGNLSNLFIAAFFISRYLLRFRPEFCSFVLRWKPSSSLTTEKYGVGALSSFKPRSKVSSASSKLNSFAYFYYSSTSTSFTPFSP